ncbi:MAG: hypothetical protein QM652_05450 [Legionella sp.]|uniref:hypothetical protein n=1 Tax=Legionella sp. TaxID=459 RepID=UPI0039E50E1D
MTVIQDKKALLAYIKLECKSKLDLHESELAIDLAIKRQLVMQAQEWNQLTEDVLKAHFDPHEIVTSERTRATEIEALHARLDAFVSGMTSQIDKEKNIPPHARSTPERLIRDYFSPAVYKAQKACVELQEKIEQKLQLVPDDGKLQNYKNILNEYGDYLNAVSNLPFVIEKLINALRQNTGQNYTPKQNAQMITALLETLQKSGKDTWNAEKLLKAIRLVTKATMPDLPADALTLGSIGELLPCVNQIIESGRELEKQKAILFPVKNPEQASTRKDLLALIGIEFVSLTSLCQETLRKPVEDALYATGELSTSASSISTEDGLDYLQIYNTFDQIGNVINGIPQEILPQSFQNYIRYYTTASQTVGQVVSGARQMAGGIGQVLGALGSTVSDYTPESIKTVANIVLDKSIAVGQKVAPTVSTAAATVGYLTPYNYTPYVPKQTFFNVGNRVWGAASSFVKKRLKQQDPAVLFWQSLKSSTSIDPNIAEAFLNFQVQVTASNSEELEEEFFQAFMEKNRIAASYTDYLAFKRALDLNTSLVTQLQSFEQAQGEEQFDKVICMLQKIKTLENQTRQGDVLNDSKEAMVKLKETLDELNETLDFQSNNPQVIQFQKLYLQPALEKCLVYYEQHFIPELEKALDSGNEELRDIYSKLKARQLLSGEDLLKLENFSHSEIEFSIEPDIEDIVQKFSPTQSKDVAKSLTPKEESRQSIQTVLDYIHPVCSHISEELKKQLEACEGLRALCPNEPLKSLCDSKIKYMQVLQQSITKLMEDIKVDNKLAEQIRRIVGGEAGADLSAMADSSMMAKQLMSLSWETLLPKSGMVAASMSEKILAYALSSNIHLKGVVEAKHHFNKIARETPPPAELMGQLGNPLQVRVNEDVVRKAVSGALDVGRSYLVEPLASYYLTSTALAFVFPQALLADIAVGILTRPTVKQQIGSYLGPVTNLFSGVTGRFSDFVSRQQEKLVEPLKELVCPMLNIEVQKVLEQKAYDYVVAEPDKRTMLNKGERDSFSGFYLQYRAIKKNNPQLDREACVHYLFRQSLADKDLETKNKIVQGFSEEYERLDNTLKSERAANTQESVLEEELLFLMNTIDFDSPEPGEIELVTMTIANRLMMMQFEASKQVSEEEARKLQQRAMNTIDAVLKNLEKADAYAHADDIRVRARAQPIIPATKLAAQIKLTELQQELSSTSQFIEGRIKDRDDRLNADLKEDEPKQLGKTVLGAEVAKATKLNLFSRIAVGLAKIATPTIFWGTLVSAFIKGGIGAGALTLLGIAGVTAGPVGILGFVGLCVIAAARVVYTTAQEVRRRDDEFQAIKESNASPIKKGMLTALTGVKCFGIGFAKAVLLDTFYQKVAGLFTQGVKPVVDTAIGARDLTRSHPTRNTLETEKQALGQLLTKLKEFQSLVDEQIKDKQIVGYGTTKPDASKFNLQKSYDERLKVYHNMQERAQKIEVTSKEITKALVDTQELLKTSSSGDARWQQGVNQELEGYKKTFNKLTEVMTHVNLIKNVELKMLPQMTVHERKATAHAKEAQAQLIKVTKSAESLQGEQGQIFLSTLKAKPSVAEMEEVAVGLRKTVAEIRTAVQQIDEHYQYASRAAKESGEVGFFSPATAITGPTSIACNKAQKSWQEAKQLRKYAEEFLLTVEAEIVERQTIESAPANSREEEILDDEDVGSRISARNF